jgi:kynurenine formamidase
MSRTVRTFIAVVLTATSSFAGPPKPGLPRAAKSPWGPGDEIGRLNLMTDASRAAILSRISAGRVYDLSVEYHKAMPSWSLLGDPTYQLWMTHTPQGTVVDDPLSLGKVHEHVSYSGDAVLMYTHTGTHIDSLAHFGLNGETWNGFRHEVHLGDVGWKKAGAEKLPPVIARGVLIDVAGLKGVDVLPDGYRITPDDLKAALAKQGVALQTGDAVFIRTGRMRVLDQPQKYLAPEPGIGLAAAKWLVEGQGAMLVGSDNLSLESFPVETKENWVPVHTYLEAEQGAAIMEVVDLEQLARDRVYEFAFIGASLKLRGASGAPMRPLAFPVRPVR